MERGLRACRPNCSEVDRVVWQLHPTFPGPTREKRNRAEKFRLNTAGWGVFRVRADVPMREGSVRKLHHDLELHYPDGSQTDS
jgi:transcription initiation factor IIF auxiliary subunit